MTEKPLSLKIMTQALQSLDLLLEKPVQLIMGGGGAMIMAHQFPLATTDIDAIPKGIDLSELDVLVKKVAIQMRLPADWMNPYFSMFSHTLPTDFRSRLVSAFNGKNLEVLALGKEDLLIMKCFAHRSKDIAHAKALIRSGADIQFVDNHITALLKKNVREAKEALEFLDDLMDQESDE